MSDDKQDYVNDEPQHVSQNAVLAISEGSLTNSANEHPTDELNIGSNKIDADARLRRTVSAKKVAANRRNSRKSTGPKTASGKKRVSRNAIKHGFYSKWLLIQHPDGKESQGEYDACYADIFKHYQPVGWLEELRVETIAVWSWRLRRMIRHESGQIARALAEHSYSLQQSRAADTAEPNTVPSSSPQIDAMTDHLFLTSEGLEEQMRYEAMINRQLNHAIAELERIQARRKGASSVV